MRKSFLALAAALIAVPAYADTLLYNVNGIQVAPDGSLQRFGGLVIGDDGKVVEVIQRPGELNRPIEREFDMGGRTLLPGLIDAHGHVMGLGQAVLSLDLTGTQSIDELKQRLKDYATANPGTGWIVGRGWNQELWPDKRMPTAADLDAVVANRPVWLGRVDGHASVGNSAAMRAAGISLDTRSTDGGRIERTADGKATGLFIDSAEELVSRHIPAATDADRDRALAAAQKALLSVGITAIADMGTSLEDWDAFRRAAASGNLNVRIMSYASALAPLQRITRPTGWLHDDHLTMVGVKLYADGALGSRGALLKRPYADLPGSSGLAVTPLTELREQAQTAASAGFQLAIHAIGDRANDEVISIFEMLGDGKNRRWRIEHVQILDPADIGRIDKADIVASMQPVHQVSDRNMAEARLGPDRLYGAYAWKSLANRGVRLAFGSDVPVESPNPFLGLSAAVSRQDPSGQPPGGWRPQERLTIAGALAGFTTGAAYAGYAEDRIGRLEPGKWADFIVIDRDPTTVDAQSLAATRVVESWVAGKRQFSAGDPPAR